MANTLRDLIVKYQGIDEETMSHLTKKSGILQTALARPASHNVYHKYKKVVALPSFSIREVSGSMTAVTVNREVYDSYLKEISALQREDIAICRNWPGGPEAFFEDQRLPFLESWGQKASNAIVYGTNSTFGDVQSFPGMWQITNATARVLHETGTSGLTTSIFAAKWDSSSCAIIFNKEQASAGNFLKSEVLNQGEPTMSTTSTTGPAEQPVYEVLWTSNLGMFSASLYDMARYDRIQDDTGDQPTAANMDKLLDYVKADPTNTFLYMNRTSRRLLKEVKDSKLELGAFDNDYGIYLDRWNGIRMVIDDNILDTETTALD